MHAQRRAVAAVEDALLPIRRSGWHLRTGDELPAEIQPLTRDEAHTLVQRAEEFPESAPFFLCALRTGMRLGELLALQWGDLDLDVFTFGGAAWRGRSPPRRTTAERVDMSKRLARPCGDYGRRASVWRSRPGRRSNRGCLTPDGTKPLDGDNLRSRVFYRLLEKAELRRIRLHDLRHTYASLLAGRVPGLRAGAARASSIQVTVDVYGHLIPGANRAAVDRLDAQPTRNPGATGTQVGQNGAK